MASEAEDFLIEIASRHAVYREGLKTHYTKAFDDFLRDMQRDILRQLSVIEDVETLKGRKLTALLRAVRKTLDTGFGNYHSVWLKQLEELGEYSAEFEIKSLGQVVKADFTIPTTPQIVTAAFASPLSVEGVNKGMLLEPFFADWTEKTYKRVEGSIRLSVAQGESLLQLMRRLRGTKTANYRDGLFHATKRDTALMARTAMHHVANQAREVVWKRNSDIVQKVEFVAVLDGRTSALCRGLSGKVFPVDKGPRPPLHMACRSVVVPKLRKGLDLLSKGGKQFSRGAKGIKRVDADMDYYDWLKTQPEAFQDSVLGASRGKLLRNGGLSATRFRDLQLDKTFSERTLAEMRELEPTAFEAAGI